VASSPKIASVLLPVAIDQTYSYSVPEHLDVAPGDVVRVPLGARSTMGVVWGPEATSDRPLKPIAERLDLPPLAADFRRFIDWVARYTLSARGMVLRMALRVDDDEPPDRPRLGLRFTGREPERATAARSRVLALAEDGLAWSKRELAHAAGVSTGVLDGLVDAGVLEAVALAPEPVAAPPDPRHPGPELTQDQRAAAGELGARLGQGFSVTLLEGVTGSGKTEAYFEAVAAVLAAGQQALVMLPEIALTMEFRERFTRRFGAPPAEWHSQLPGRRRARLWHGVAKGEVRAVVGARSALFLPFAELGLIVIDEEHDPAYKQEDRVLYHARDMGVVRGLIERIPVVLSSATPSLESHVNAREGRYGHAELPARFSGAMPRIEAVDLRSEGPERGRWLAPRLVEAVAEAVGQGQQALLFLNRRGYAPLTLCRLCGHRLNCPNCSAWLVEHRFRRELRCHHCGHQEWTPPTCPNCLAAGSLVPCGPGVERVAEEVTERFPGARSVVLSSDIFGGVERLRSELQAVAAGEVDIVIGTQLVAKGHNFPKLTVVGVVDADLGLAQGDPRAAERTFQLLTQVVGRAGRASRNAVGLLQTYDPEQPVMRAILSGDAANFYAVEAEERRLAGLPPYGRLAALIVSGEPRSDPLAFARALAQAAPEDERVRVLGPAEAPLAMLRGRQRFRLLVKTTRGFDLQAYLNDWLAAGPEPKGGVRLTVDVDPQSFL